jgi:dihydroneopterin aldolase / 2-amino-4-hydroxy-6-hydroxymethyldihydropteridine diphosphokinase
MSAGQPAGDRITLRGLRVFGYHGVLDAEREEGQEFLVDAVLWLDTAAAAATDDLELTANYAALADRLAAVVAGPPVRLIETLAQRLAEAATATEPRAREVEITVHKPNAPVGHRFGDVSVTIRRPAQGQHVVLALGSNLGDRLATLQGAVRELLTGPGLTLTALSPVYETAPVGGPPQPDYLNAVLVARTTLPPGALLHRCQQAEQAFHRTRQEVWGPRTLDVDIIVYGDLVSDDPVLTLPHPRARERAFVLAPWLDAEPAAEIPGQGQVAGLLAAADRSGVRRRDDLKLRAPS